jgi:hypothetical protein
MQWEFFMASCSGQTSTLMRAPMEKLESRRQRDRLRRQASKNVTKQLQLGVPGDNNRARKSMTNTCKSGEKDSD